MGTVFIILGGLLALAGFCCSIVILIEAFKDEIWKGIVCLICGLYTLYYALVEFDHEYKWPIVGTAFLGGGLGGYLMQLGLHASGVR